MTPTTVLSVENLCVAYAGIPVLAGVTLAIDGPSILAVIGPSGCGKSTMLHALNRMLDLVPGARVSGCVVLGGDDVLADDADVTQIRRRIGLVHQRPTPLPFSIEKNFALPLREHGVSDRHERAARTETALRAVGLWTEVKDRLRAHAASLSVGQQQRLCIARAIALEPAVLLLDEPTSSLDPISSARVEETVLELAMTLPILFVTHALPQARRVAHRTAFLDCEAGVGRLVEIGATQQVFDAPVHARTRQYVREST